MSLSLRLVRFCLSDVINEVNTHADIVAIAFPDALVLRDQLLGCLGALREHLLATPSHATVADVVADPTLILDILKVKTYNVSMSAVDTRRVYGFQRAELEVLDAIVRNVHEFRRKQLMTPALA